MGAGIGPGGVAGLQGAVVPAAPPSPEGSWRLEVARVLWAPSSLVSWWKAQAPVGNAFCWQWLPGPRSPRASLTHGGSSVSEL